MKKINKLLYKLTNSCKLLRRLVDTYERGRNKIVVERETPLQVGWSFIVITNGSCTNNLKEVIASILDEFNDDSNYEIIVIGQNGDYPIEAPNIRYVEYHSVGFMPGWITLKKNIGVKLAAYDKCVVTHDYVTLCKGWKKGFFEFGHNFDVCTNPILFKDGRRARDWTVYDYPEIGAALLPYSVYSDYIYISGTYFVVKTAFYLSNPLDETLRWGESEDVEWTRRIRNKSVIALNCSSCCQFIKDKPLKEAPYSEIWVKRTLKLYEKYGLHLDGEQYELQVLKN